MDVAVLLGGRSPEHDVSIASATQVLQHVDRTRHRVRPVLLDRDGGWRVAAQWLRPDAPFRVEELRARPARRPGAALADLLDAHGVDCVFPVLHGPYGEDGTVQGMLELHDVPFVGSGCAASAVAMDKLRTRQVYCAAGLPVAPAYEPGPGVADDAAAAFAAMQAAIGTPAFVKVDTSGSTVGVARVRTEAELRDFLRHFGRCRRWFAERAVLGEEITVPVLGNAGGPLEPLPPVGIYPVDDEWFTHDAKYRPGATEEIVPPRGLTAAAIAEVQELAARCHELLVCDGMSRTDMIVTAEGPVVLETNTIPGLTTNSLLPRAAKAAGYTFSALIDRLLELAIARAGAADAASRPDMPGAGAPRLGADPAAGAAAEA